MAIDFKSMAANAKETYEAHEAEKLKERSEQKAARGEQVQSAIKLLNKFIRPALDQAHDAFMETGVETKITTDFDVETFVIKNPSISFQCISPKRRSDGYQMEAPAIYFISDGKTIEIKAAEYEHDNEGKIAIGVTEPPNKIEPLIEKAVQKALDAYYHMMEKYGRNLGS